MKLTKKIFIALVCSATIGFSQTTTSEYKQPLKPKVYMGMCNLKDLTYRKDLKKWTYVRENLHGLWVNGAGTGKKNIVTLFEAVKTRKALFIGSLTSRNPFELGSGFLTFHKALVEANIELEEPGLVVVNDYLSKKAKDPLRYYYDGDLQRAANFVKNTSENNYGDIFKDRFYITTRHGPFTKNVYDEKKDPNNILQGKAYGTFLDAKGMVYERDAKELGNVRKYQESYLQAFNLAHKNNKEFFWLCPRGNNGTKEEFIEGLKSCYSWMQQKQAFPDVIVIINYSRKQDKFEMFPMVDDKNKDITPPTFTGALYWALQQYNLN